MKLTSDTLFADDVSEFLTRIVLGSEFDTAIILHLQITNSPLFAGQPWPANNRQVYTLAGEKE